MIRKLKIIAIAEGISYLTFAITMPLKYGLDILWPNKVIGWIHGFLFIIYVIAMTYAAIRLGWALKKWLIIMIASLIPLAPFYVEKKIL